MRQELRRREEGYRFLEQERVQRIRSTQFKDVVHLYDLAFEASKQKPLRTTSGLVEWYRYLMKTREP
jgi:hypothetical protein